MYNLSVKYSYFSTFPAGFGDLVVEVVKRVLTDVEILAVEDGLVVYETSSGIEVLRRLPFFANTFVLIVEKQLERMGSTEEIVENLFRQARLRMVEDLILGLRARTFRIYASRESQTVGLDKRVLGKFEMVLEKVLQIRVNRSLADVEFWFVIRSSGRALFGLRLAAVGGKKEKYEAGELKREITYLLHALVEPTEEDVLLDPFAGTGAIGLEAERSFGYKQIILADSDEALVKKMKERVRGVEKILVLRQDARHLDKIENDSVTKVVTDPPWGLFTEVANLKDFYGEVMSELVRVVRHDGMVVVLTAAKQEFEEAIARVQFLNLITKIDVLISGKKAGVYVIKITKNYVVG